MPKQSRAWKADELKVARAFRVSRSAVPGGSTDRTNSDTTHPSLYIEVKRRKKHTVVTLWDDVKKKALSENKVPVVALCEHGRPGFWVCVHSSDLVAVVEAMEHTYEHEES